MREKRYFQRTGKKIFINANILLDIDKSKVLATVEEQLITYRKNEVLFSEEVAVLKREVACKDYEINVLKSEFEKVRQEKEGIEFKIEKFDKASKDLDKLLGSQITDKSKKGLGYNVVPLPYPLIYNQPKKLDLSYSGLDEFKDPEFKSCGSKDSKQESNIVCDKKSNASKENSVDSLVKEQVSEDTSSFVESPLNVDKETIFLDKKIEIVKPKNHENPVKKSVSPKDMFTMGASHTLEATHVEFFSDEEEPKVDLGNITNSYTVPTTPHTRIHKDHPIMNVIGHRAIGTKWIFRNKKDERGIVIRNKARLVAQGHTQEEGIDYDEVFAHVARIKAIRLFLSYASFMGFMVYQIDVKSAFLYGQIEEEVYVCQPPGFEDPDYPDKVYKVVKALYSLHQAPRAWYETLANYLLGNGFQRGKIDQPLFIKKQKGDILLVQIYVDDIIFGSTKKEMCNELEKLMKDKFQISLIGELTFFLGLQVKQKEDGIFISQDKYVAKIFKKFNYIDVKSMIGSLMYLTTSRLDIIYLKGKPTLGLWYSKNSLFELVAYTDSDYAGATQDRKSTTRGCQFLGNRLISWQCKKQTVVATSTTEAEYVAAASCCGQVGDKAVHKELGDRMERAATTTSGLEAEHDSVFYDKHNMVAYLLKSKGSEGFHQIIGFLNARYIKYALTENPTIYASFIKQFWRTPTASIDANGQVELIASIDEQEKTITKASLRRHLKLLLEIKDFKEGFIVGVTNSLFPTMLTAPESSPSGITSSPSLSPQTHPSTLQPQPTFVVEEPASMSHESPLQSVHSPRRDEGSLTLLGVHSPRIS
ncbi:putative ribonuclease H-like domain-containing protein [Tanacetum coccineum]